MMKKLSMYSAKFITDSKPNIFNSQTCFSSSFKTLTVKLRKPLHVTLSYHIKPVQLEFYLLKKLVGFTGT